MDAGRIENELAELRRRVAELESRIGLTRPDGDPVRERAVAEAPQTPVDAVCGRAAESGTSEAQTPPPVPPTERLVPDDRGCLVPESTLWTEANRQPQLPSREPDNRPRAQTNKWMQHRTAAEMELRIGGSWMAWAGALLVILSSGFFVKFAYDQGWLGLIPKTVRCLMCAALGGALIAAGEAALRRIGRAAAVGLFAAGLGVLYVTADASFRYFELVSTDTAFLLAFVVALIGVAITVRGQLVVIGVLSLIGGYLAPVILGGPDSPPVALGIYLTMLLSIALALSFWKPTPYQTLRTTAMALHGLLATAWMIGEGSRAPVTCVTFATIWWVLVNAEVLATVLRGGPSGGGARASFAATAWLAGLGAWTIAAASPAGREWLGTYTGSIAVLLGGLLALARQPMTVLSRRPAATIEKLCVSYWLQLGVMLTVAIGLQFDGRAPGQSLCWLALGLGAVELGRRLASVGASVFGMCVGVLALVNIVTFDATVAWLDSALVVLGERHTLDVSPMALLGLVAIAATIAAALRVRLGSGPTSKDMPGMISAVAALSWLIWGKEFCGGCAVSLAWALGGAGLLSARRFGAAQRFAEFGVGLVAAAAIRWVSVDLIATRSARDWTPEVETLLLNLPMATGVLLACLVQWCAAVMAAMVPGGNARAAAVARGAAPLLLVAGLSFEVERAIGLHGALAEVQWRVAGVRLLSLSAFWGAAAWAIVRFAERRADGVVAHVGRGLGYFAAFVWMVPAAIAAREGRPAAEVWLLINLQGLAGVLIAGAMARVAQSTMTDAAHRRIASALVGLLGLWIGSIELDRAVSIYRDALPARAMARQAGLSVYWGAYAIVILTIGFVRRQRECRWAGLGLLAVTTGKVLLLDMAAVAYGYRVLSFFVTGLLLIGVSIVYARVARRMDGVRGLG